MYQDKSRYVMQYDPSKGIMTCTVCGAEKSVSMKPYNKETGSFLDEKDCECENGCKVSN